MPPTEPADAALQLGVPTKITKADGVELDPGAVVREVLNDGDTVYVSHSLEPQDVEREG